MPPKKEKKAKNEKKPPGEGGPSGPTAEEAAAALKKRCARLEEEEKQVRDLCARLRQENADKKLTLEASRADSDEAEHLATTTADGDARERAAHVAQLTHETSLLRAAVAQLRAQRDRRDEVGTPARRGRGTKRGGAAAATRIASRRIAAAPRLPRG